MKLETAKRLWRECLTQFTDNWAEQYAENPAIRFSNNAKAGRYDSLSDEEYDDLLADIEDMSTLWSKQRRQPVGTILLNLLERTAIPPDQIDRLAGQLAEWYTWPESKPKVDGAAPVPASVFAPRRPAEIRDAIAGSVIGQPEAVKAAAMITYNHLAGRRTNAVFCGPSGCGKSETWRCLSKEYPGLIRIVDFSRMSADGWKGSFHLRDIFTGIDPDKIRRRGLIVVLDEADKILCEHAFGAGGTDYHVLVQNDLLKMMDGDRIEFGAHDSQPALSVNCAKVSVVMLGTFERLLEDKAANSKVIGFGAAPKTDAGSHKNISYDDLIHAGMRREVASRINKIVALSPLSADGCREILRGPVLSGLQMSIGCGIRIDDDAVDALIEQAVQSQLGVRWMRSAIQNAIDEALFDASGAENYIITMREGKLLCRAETRQSPAGPHAGPDDNLDPDDQPLF